MQDIYAYALRLLLRKNYFTGELIKSLRKKFPDDDITDVIEKLKKDRYLDDERLFNSFVRWKGGDGYGPYYISDKLRLKGINKSISEIKDALADADIDMEKIMRQVFKKYIRSKKIKNQASFFRSCVSYMSNKGFDIAESIKIIKEEVVYESDFFEEC